LLSAACTDANENVCASALLLFIGLIDGLWAFDGIKIIQ
jgi:hypothetical protein